MKEAILAMWIASVADLATTEMAIARYGAVELNPLQADRGVRIMSHVAVPMLMTIEGLRRPDDKRLKILVWIAAMAWSAAATHNFIVMVRL